MLLYSHRDNLAFFASNKRRSTKKARKSYDKEERITSMQTVFETYYRLTECATVDTAQKKEAVLKLVAAIEGFAAGTNEYDKISQIIVQIDSLGLKTSIDCANWLFLNAFSSQKDTEENKQMEMAVSAKHQVLQKLNTAYLSPWECYQTMIQEDKVFDLAIHAYANGNITSCMDKLKTLADVGDLRAVESLAFIFHDVGNYDQTLFYLYSARILYRKINCTEKAWITNYIQTLQARFTLQQIEVIKNKASQPSYSKKTIGFTSQL